MTYTVLKPFPHINRRFTVGDVVTEVDLIGSTLAIDDLKRGKYIANSDTKTAEKAATKADLPDAVEPLAVADNATAFEVEKAMLAREIDKPHKR